jgi:Na+/phosphate symporter
MKQDKYFELRIFICFILTIFYVQYTVLVNKNNEPSTVEVLKEKALDGFEVRIINDHANERLELTETLDQALAYIKEYSMHHDDLVAFNLSTGSIVAKSNPIND